MVIIICPIYQLKLILNSYPDQIKLKCNSLNLSISKSWWKWGIKSFYKITLKHVYIFIIHILLDHVNNGERNVGMNYDVWFAHSSSLFPKFTITFPISPFPHLCIEKYSVVMKPGSWKLSGNCYPRLRNDGENAHVFNTGFLRDASILVWPWPATFIYLLGIGQTEWCNECETWEALFSDFPWKRQIACQLHCLSKSCQLPGPVLW